MKALVAMCIGLVNDQNKPLINLAEAPWKDLNKAKSNH